MFLAFCPLHTLGLLIDIFMLAPGLAMQSPTLIRHWRWASGMFELTRLYAIGSLMVTFTDAFMLHSSYMQTLVKFVIAETFLTVFYTFGLIVVGRTLTTEPEKSVTSISVAEMGGNSDITFMQQSLTLVSVFQNLNFGSGIRIQNSKGI